MGKKTLMSDNIKENFDFSAENVLRFQLFLKSLFFDACFLSPDERLHSTAQT